MKNKMEKINISFHFYLFHGNLIFYHFPNHLTKSISVFSGLTPYHWSFTFRPIKVHRGLGKFISLCDLLLCIVRWVGKKKSISFKSYHGCRRLSTICIKWRNKEWDEEDYDDGRKSKLSRRKTYCEFHFYLLNALI